MKKKIFMSAAKKARIALAVMAVCGFTLAGAQSAFAADPSPTTEHPVKIDDKKNIICGEGATASRNELQKDDGTNIVVIGNNATGIGSETIAIGYNAKAEGEYSIAFGSSAYAFYGGVSIGDLSKTTYGAVAIGLRAKGSGRDSVAIGKDAKAEGQDSLAIADSSVAKGEKSVALGYQAKAAGETSIAMGYRSSAEAKGSFALGSNSSVTKENSVAIGTGSVANRNNSVSVGSGGSEFYGPQYRQIINVAYGTDKNDAATYGQILRDTWSTIKIDDDGNGSTKLTKNDGTQGPTINVDASSLNKKITRNTNSITALDNKIGSLNADGNYIKKANNVSQNLSALDNKVKANEGAITAVDNKIGSLSADGNYIKKGNNVSKNLSALDDKVKENTDAINTKADKDLSNITDAGKNVIKDLAGNKAGEIVDIKLGDITSENYVNKADTVNANISALDKQVKANEGAITAVDNKIGSLNADGNYIKKANNVSQNLSALDNKVKANEGAITAVDNKIGSLSADGNYIKKGNNVSKNLSALDDKVKENTDAINTKADKDLSNITDAGKNVIKDLAGNKAGEIVDIKLGDITSENYVNKADTVNANISALDKQVKANESAITVVDNKIGSLNADGNYIKKGNNVSKNLSVLDDKVKANEGAITAVDNKIGSLNADGNYIKKDNDVSNNLSALDDKVKENADAINTKADKDLSNITDAGKDVIKNLANEKAGEIVDTKLGDITSENYVKKTDTVNANISALDKQVKANADAINTKADKDLSNISDAGKDVIKDLAGNKAGEIVDTKLGDITSENYVNKADTVNANISALDKQMKVNTDNIGDTGKLTAAGLGSNLSDAVVKVNDKVGTADELKVLKDAGLGDNLAQATAAVNKKADKNAEDIKNVNGRVDELGGRVDTLGGAVSKLDTKVNKVGAGAAALAALHPMDFDPDNKLTFAAGVGNYRGANAAAIGAFYRPSEQVMFSIAGNMGNGENMVNAGVSFALDRPSKTPTTKAALVKTVAAQNEQIAALNETVAEQNEKIARLEAMVEKLVAKQNA